MFLNFKRLSFHKIFAAQKVIGEFSPQSISFTKNNQQKYQQQKKKKKRKAKPIKLRQYQASVWFSCLPSVNLDKSHSLLDILEVFC